MIEPKDQQDLLRQALYERGDNQEVSEELTPPGYETLHLRDAKEVGAVLANVMKSRPRITGISWTVGGPIVIKYIKVV